jgi:hypothetical protein
MFGTTPRHNRFAGTFSHTSHAFPILRSGSRPDLPQRKLRHQGAIAMKFFDVLGRQAKIPQMNLLLRNCYDICYD